MPVFQDPDPDPDGSPDGFAPPASFFLARHDRGAAR